MPKSAKSRIAFIAVASLMAQCVLADSPRHIDIPAGDLENALDLLSKQSGTGVVYRPEQVRGFETKGVKGELTTRDAVMRLLEGTPLKLSLDSTGAMLISAPPSVVPSRSVGAQDSVPTASAAQDTEAAARKLHMARMDPQSAEADRTGNEPADDEPAHKTGELEEVVVTANRRPQNLNDVPTSISALDQQAIERRSLVGMGDYLNTLPGVSVQDMGAGRNSIVIRGIGISELDRDITGVYFGEVPLTSLAYFGSADIKLVDMARVEVLRGPQGTLYGAGAMGGAVRSIPAPPDTARMQGSVSATYSQTAAKGSGNHSFEGTFNLPLVENKLAIRAVGYQFENSGFYVNRAASDPTASAVAAAFGVPELAKDENDVGNDEYRGGRIAALWTLTDAFNATLTFMRQKLEQQGFPEVELDLGQGQWGQARLQMAPARFRDVASKGGASQLKDDLEVSNLVLDYDLRWAKLTSSTSWVDEFAVRSLDNTHLFGVPAVNLQGNRAEGFFQELRLASQFSGALQFIGGVYYEDLNKRKDVANDYDGQPDLDPFPGPRLLNIAQDTNRKQKAVFGELTYQIAPTWAATVGGRIFHYKVVDHIVQGGSVVPLTDALLRTSQSEDSYKASLSFKPNSNALVYAQWAQGFRLGFPQQPVVPQSCDLDGDGLIDGTNVSTGISRVDSDFLDTTELGVKLKMLNNHLGLHAAVYEATWDGMPVLTGFPCNAEVRLNVGQARSRGAEVSISWQLSDGLKADVNASYTDAKISKSKEGLGEKGDRLPGSPRVGYSVALQYDFDVSGLASYVASDVSYRGKLFNNLQSVGPSAGDYYLLNARAGVRVQGFDVALFVQNLTNKDDLVWVDELFNDSRAYRMRPRTVGMEVAYRF